MLWKISFFILHKLLDGVFDKGLKGSMAGHLLCSPFFERRRNESRVDQSLRLVGVQGYLYDFEGIERAQPRARVVSSSQWRSVEIAH